MKISNPAATNIILAIYIPIPIAYWYSLYIHIRKYIKRSTTQLSIRVITMWGTLYIIVK